MVELTIPSLEQIKNSEILKKYGNSAIITDFAILVGGFPSTNYKAYLMLPKYRTSSYWTTTPHNDGENCIHIIEVYGNERKNYTNNKEIGIRPILSYSNISDNLNNNKIKKCGISKIKYGELPQRAVSKEWQNKLETLYINNDLEETGKTYTTDSRKWNEPYKVFEPQEYIEYEYKGKKYVRIMVNSRPHWFLDKLILSNGEKYQNGDYVWIEVLPIKWLVDEKQDIIISTNIIFSGIQFDNKNTYDGNFKNTNMYWFLNNILINDIIVNKTKESKNQKIFTKKLK